MLTVGSLFSGIGGLDLGLERAGMEVIWQSEIDPYACRVLKKHWPEVPNHGDIKRIDWGDVVRPDVLCGGYPCQPFSTAGKRKGEEDPRHLWPWVRDAISVLRPRYAILENVRGHVSLGLSTVLGEMASIGYDAEWRIVSAASVGANHRRDRIIIVAYPNSASGQQQCERQIQEPDFERRCEAMAYPSEQFSNGRGHHHSASPARSGHPVQASPGGSGVGVANPDGNRVGSYWTTAIARQTHSRRVYHGNRQEGYDGGEWWETEPDVGRVADGIPSRVDRLRGLGNAVVPQVAEVIGRLVVEHATHN